MYDIAVIGGGINGCGIARDAAGRGYSVFLAEKGDLASGTSSGSTKLIHGGLRYLEHYEFRLVREALKEREVLWGNAPHIVWPLRFVLPHAQGMRPAWLLRLGLFLYDHLGGRRLLAGTAAVDLSAGDLGAPLKPHLVKGFEYSDCWVDDARLVVLNARDAADRGSLIETRTAITRIERMGDHWRIATRDQRSGATSEVAARIVVNAAGAWVDDVGGRIAGGNAARRVRLVQGSHIVVTRLYAHDRCYIFQNPDGRIFFAIPYEGAFTLIGTTDRDFDGSPDAIDITDEEIDYLLASVNGQFRRQLSRDDICWTYSAVRPLYDDGASAAQEATRDYVLQLEGTADQPKLLNVFGGKITTYRRLAEAALENIDSALGRDTTAWTADAPLPGGDFPVDGYEAEVTALAQAYPFLGMDTARRLVRAYGTCAAAMLGDAQGESDLGKAFGAGLTEREVRYLQECEWAETADDILWRRSKLGLHLTKPQREHLAGWLAQNPATGA